MVGSSSTDQRLSAVLEGALAHCCHFSLHLTRLADVGTRQALQQPRTALRAGPVLSEPHPTQWPCVRQQ